jgi:hypothetical protein
MTGKASSKLRAAVEDEAARLAQVRGAAAVKTVWRPT